jgi:hypothetical protein
MHSATSTIPMWSNSQGTFMRVIHIGGFSHNACNDADHTNGSQGIYMQYFKWSTLKNSAYQSQYIRQHRPYQCEQPRTFMRCGWHSQGFFLIQDDSVWSNWGICTESLDFMHENRFTKSMYVVYGNGNTLERFNSSFDRTCKVQELRSDWAPAELRLRSV